MRVRDLLSPESIELQGHASSKSDVIRQMVDLMVRRGNINDRETYEKGVFAREEESTTGIGDGIAIPHCKSDAVSAPGLAAMVLPDGVEYDALDGEPVHIIFLIAAPNTEDNVHLDVLARLSELLMDPDFVTSLENAKTKDEFLSVIDKAESGKVEADEQKALAALDRVTEKWSPKYPNSMKRWKDNWDAVSPIFKFSATVRKVIYTTNAIESLNSTYRKLNRQRSVFPSDTALLKALYLATFEATKKWTTTIESMKLFL